MHMSQSVLTVTKDMINKMIDYYKKDLKEKVPPGAYFAAKVNGCSITAYRSGKVLFQGAQHEQEASRWDGEFTTKQRKEKTEQTIPACVHKSHIGSDEAGSGDFFGPLTAAAVFVDEKKIPLLQELGVRDSKLMKDDKILEVAKQIQLAEVPYSILVLHNEKYNTLQRKGWTQGKMKAMLHYHAISKVLEKMNGMTLDGIVVDQFAERQVFAKHLASENITLPDKMHFLTKAETYSIAVAAASILSRAKFVQEMNKLSKKIGFTLQKGASSLVDEQAAKIILSKGRNTLSSISKVHFANMKKAEDLVRKRMSH